MQVALLDAVLNNSTLIRLARTAIIVVVLFVAFRIGLGFMRRAMLKRAKTKKQISNVHIVSNVINVIFLVVLVIFAVMTYAGSWVGLGLGVGLFSAALGWALQRPVTGVAAWIMIVIKRPFDIGDRIIVGNVRGDVSDITLTHIYLREIGGIVPSEENSGRIILVPNSILFEQNIINYTLRDEYILDEVIVLITYESDIDRVKDIILREAKKDVQEFAEATKTEPYLRTYFQPSGINIHVRYHVPSRRIQEISSAVTYDIFKAIQKDPKVKIAYPHRELIMHTEGKK